MRLREWLSDNIVSVTIALVLINLVVVYWATINWGFANGRLLLGQPAVSRDADSRAPVDRRPVPGSSSALRLTCAGDDDLASAFASVRTSVVNITAQERSLGSGLIVDRSGYIVTNAHVVATAPQLKAVTFGFERKAYPAEIVLKDTQKDIAVLKIQPEAPLSVPVLGDSEMVKVADTVLAVGSPFGLEQTVTAGIISDDSRDLIIEGVTYEAMIQTDAAINRGNSGGPLVNVQGEVIGINTAIYAPTGVFTGVGFVIPINRVKPIIREALSM